MSKNEKNNIIEAIRAVTNTDVLIIPPDGDSFSTKPPKTIEEISASILKEITEG